MKTIFITGASSGLGEALARELSNEGVALGLLSRRLERLDLLANDLPGTVCSFSADVGDPLAMRAAAEEFIRSVGVPDVVIANAGISAGTMTNFAADQEVFERIMRTNVLGIVNTFQPFIDAMERRGSGTLVGISSIAGFRGIPGSGAYSASKAAATAYLESLRVELSSSGVRVLTVCPGYIKTAMTDVNPFYMPFLMDAGAAARSIKKAIDKQKRFHVMPWQMRIVACFLRLLPRLVYEQLFKRAPRKPRSL
ncbi:MAG: SDR family oxidoreductase [Proteobacteria bacterium]|nr:SDR family oxidoreductase [Pseudomonadota bacterium]